MPLWPAEPVLRTTFVQYLITFYSRPEATSDAISSRFVGPIIPDNTEKFDDPRLNLSREIPPETVGGGSFGRFSNVDNIRPEVDTDVVSGKIIERPM